MENLELTEIEKSNLEELIRLFFEDKTSLDSYKKSTEELNTQIKDIMNNFKMIDFATEDGLVAKVTNRTSETFNEELLINKLKELNLNDIIKTVEVIDYDKLENAIYNNQLNAEELTPFKIVKTSQSLKVSKRK